MGEKKKELAFLMGYIFLIIASINTELAVSVEPFCEKATTKPLKTFGETTSICFLGPRLC